MASFNKTENKGRQAKRSCPDSGTSDDDTFEVTEVYPRWLVIQGVDKENKALSQLSPFTLGKALKCQVGTLKSVRRLQRGDILVETDSQVYANELLKMSSLANVPVAVSAHRTLNSSKGVIRSRDVARCDKQEIIDNLRSQGVTDAVVVMVKTGNSDERRITNTVILSFNKPQPPTHIKAGYLRILVAPYVPNPLRCFQCQKFGHGRQYCKGEQVCSRCGESGHDYTLCQKAEHCSNCNGDHAASSKACPKWQLEQKVQQIKSEKNISFVEARKLAQQSTKPTMATIVTSAMRPSTSVQTRSVEVQTDLTWPAGIEMPTQLVHVVRQKTSAATATEDVGCAAEKSTTEKSKQGGKGKPSHPKITRPPSSSQPATDTNRYAVLAPSQTEEGEASSSVIK